MEDNELKSLNLIGKSEAFLRTLESVRQVAPTQITVLITGESGTGKEVLAEAIHTLSPRKDHPLLKVNCGAIPEGILESELFGHEKGSFTGASEMRKGYFELAHQGTLFLDEIGEMPLQTQVKLLRVLETKEFMRVGGTKVQKVDVRVIAATNRDLETAVQRNEFRKDLFYRLNAVKIEAPPLRYRVEDVRPLSIYFAEEIIKTNQIPFEGFTDDAFQVMEAYHWPGNIRELRNVVERSIVLGRGRMIDSGQIGQYLESPADIYNVPMVINKSSEQSERELIYRALVDIRVALEDLRRLVLQTQTPQLRSTEIRPDYSREIRPDIVTGPIEEIDLNMKNLEKMQIEKALIRFKHNRRKAAKALGLGERTLYRKIKEYGLE